MLREDIVKVLEIVAVFLADIRVDDVEVISYELRAAHQLSLCSVGVHVATRSVCQAMQQRLIELHVSFMARYRLRFIALYRWENRLIWTMTEEQAIAAADVAFEESLEEARASSRRKLRECVRSTCEDLEWFLLHVNDQR